MYTSFTFPSLHQNSEQLQINFDLNSLNRRCTFKNTEFYKGIVSHIEIKGAEDHTDFITFFPLFFPAYLVQNGDIKFKIAAIF